jgi:hypothetical protein
MKVGSKLAPLLLWLLCAFIFISAIDQIPDPPTVSPTSVHAASRSIGEHLPAVFEDKTKLVCRCTIRSIAERWFEETHQTLRRLPPLIRLASDTSPPSFCV